MSGQISRFKDYVLCASALGTGPRSVCSILWRETKNIRVRLGLSRYNPTAVYVLPTIYGPLSFRDNFGDITNLVGIFHHRVYGDGPLADEGVILDVGANIGLAASWFAHHNPGRAIYCFEPVAANAAMIPLNCPSAQVERIALGAEVGRVGLHVDRQSVMASRLPCPWVTEEHEFAMRSLDEWIDDKVIDRIALMKIDVEGMEEEVLRGAAATLKRTRRVVLETHSRALHHAVLKQLTEAGFEIESERFFERSGLVSGYAPGPGGP